MGEAGLHDVHMSAAKWLSPFPQLLQNKRTYAFLSTLAWDEEISPPYARLAFVLLPSK